MTVHKNRTHHRPRVEKPVRLASKWAFPWRASCTCGWKGSKEMLWRNALVSALIHAEKVL